MKEKTAENERINSSHVGRRDGAGSAVEDIQTGVAAIGDKVKTQRFGFNTRFSMKNSIMRSRSIPA
jgi:hypothetical protein